MASFIYELCLCFGALLLSPLLWLIFLLPCAFCLLPILVPFGVVISLNVESIRTRSRVKFTSCVRSGRGNGEAWFARSMWDVWNYDWELGKDIADYYIVYFYGTVLMICGNKRGKLLCFFSHIIGRFKYFAKLDKLNNFEK